MNLWFTRTEARIARTFLKRFDPLHWSVDFPRGTIASMFTGTDPHRIDIAAELLREGDLVGLIWDSEDRLSHPAHAREYDRDYAGCVLSFRWQSTGLRELDAINGPTLTIEAKDENGDPRNWYVRLWNYAVGTPADALVTLDFDALDGGFTLPIDADRVEPTRIERMFISLVAPGYVEGSEILLAAPAQGRVAMSNIKCDGSGSVIHVNDALAPAHGLRIATAYDDMYNLPPERIVQGIERLGYRGTINHYVGMSHYFALGADGRLDPARNLNSAALDWHRAFADAAKAHGYELIWSLSYELLDMFCPEAWKQRAADGSPALTGWDPPSALISPANADGIAYLGRVAAELMGLAVDAELTPRFQVGEPWWWIRGDGTICLYDDAATAAFGGSPVAIPDVRGTLSQAQKDLLDEAGELLAQSTAAVVAAASVAAPDLVSHILVYLPTVVDPVAPEARRANVPLGWARPAFDVLQLEDYDWVTGQHHALRSAAYSQIDARLGYARSEQHYLSGFVLDPADRADWRVIIDAAIEAKQRGVAESFLWALPQVIRDGLTLFGEEADVTPFDDVLFPIEIGAEASVAPGFSTNIVTAASGHEARNANWSQARLRFDAGPGVRGDAELETLLAFFRARRGPAVGFRFRDPYDYSSGGMTGAAAASDQAIGSGDAARERFELVKTYGGGEARRITRPVPGSVRVAIGGVEQASGWTLTDKGVIQFAAAPASGVTVTAGFLFDTPVRFAEDRIEVNRATFLAGEAPSVPLVEVRED